MRKRQFPSKVGRILESNIQWALSIVDSVGTKKSSYSGPGPAERASGH